MNNIMYKTNLPESNCLYSHSSTYSVSCNEDGKTIVNNSPCNSFFCIKDNMDELNNQTKKVIIQFNDKEYAEYDSAECLQDFLDQVRNYHDLEKAFNNVVKKLLNVKPELKQWVDMNFKQYLK